MAVKALVRYTGCSDEQVRFGGCADPRGLLVEGRAYWVEAQEPHTWHTKVYLTEHPGLGFNSVCFVEE